MKTTKNVEIVIDILKNHLRREIRNREYELLDQCYQIILINSNGYHYSFESWAINYLDISIRKYRAILRKFGAEKLVYYKKWKNGEWKFIQQNYLYFKNLENAEKAIIELEKYLILNQLMK